MKNSFIFLAIGTAILCALCGTLMFVFAGYNDNKIFIASTVSLMVTIWFPYIGYVLGTIGRTKHPLLKGTNLPFDLIFLCNFVAFLTFALQCEHLSQNYFLIYSIVSHSILLVWLMIMLARNSEKISKIKNLPKTK